MLFATDDWFAVAENMLKDTDPISNDKYTDCGKWMDGWETRRKRIPGHDWCIIKIGAPCVIRGVLVDTAFFTGNFAPRVSVQGTVLSDIDLQGSPTRRSKIGTACNNEELRKIDKLNSDHWDEVVEMTTMKAGYEETRKNYIYVNSNEVYTHLRINMYPDGGIARFHVFGDIVTNIDDIPSDVTIDLISMQNGGACVEYSNAHYGHPRNLIKPGRGLFMGDGWETGRRLDRPAILEADDNGILKVPGCEWATMKMCCIGAISEIIVDTNHFKGNFPDSVQIDGTFLHEDETLMSAEWVPVLARRKLSAHREHHYSNEIWNRGPFNYLRIIMAPDGGISRVRIFGNKLDDYME